MTQLGGNVQISLTRGGSHRKVMARARTKVAQALIGQKALAISGNTTGENSCQVQSVPVTKGSDCSMN